MQGDGPETLSFLLCGHCATGAPVVLTTVHVEPCHSTRPSCARLVTHRGATFEGAGVTVAEADVEEVIRHVHGAA